MYIREIKLLSLDSFCIIISHFNILPTESYPIQSPFPPPSIPIQSNQPTHIMHTSSLLPSLALLLPLTHAIRTTTSSRRQAPNYPPHSQSQSFNLIANVTCGDLSPSINSWILTSYHVGAGEAYAVLEQDYDVGRTFYVNGTAEEVRFNAGDLLSDEGTPVS